MKRFTLPIATQPQRAAALVKPKFARQSTRDKQEVDGQVFVPRHISESTDRLLSTRLNVEAESDALVFFLVCWTVLDLANMEGYIVQFFS